MEGVIGWFAKFLQPLINKNGRSELIQAAIVLCIKELTEYLYQ